MKLYLKGDRCYSEKCSFTRRPYPPGQHGQGRIKLSEYAIRLREKQKVRRIYGVLEKQFRSYSHPASARKGRTGEEMLALLEMRLDKVVYRMGFGSSRSDARQLLRHGHVKVNGRRVDIPSYIAKAGDEISLTEKGQKFARAALAAAGADRRPMLSLMDIERDKFKGTVKARPVRDELNEPLIDEQLVVEYYSR